MKSLLVFLTVVSVLLLAGGSWAAAMEATTSETSDSVAKCNLPIERGRCFAYFPRFAYDSSKGECVEFGYGGCNGNSNNFETKEECEETCQVAKLN